MVSGTYALGYCSSMVKSESSELDETQTHCFLAVWQVQIP